MAKVVGDVAVKVTADISALQTNMERAGSSLRTFQARHADTARKIVRTGAVITASVTAMSAAYIALLKQSAEVGAEISRQAAIAGTGTTEFQKLAVAARTVGVDQAKLADILKDVNDKFGDFMANGAGPLKDFFDNIGKKVGVTAEQFARLSGPEALQLYVSSLEKAGVSQQQMTFYLEALASDATALAPLLRNGGRELRILGDEAQRTGRIMDQDTVESARRLNDKFDAMKDSIRNELISALISTEEELAVLAQFVEDFGIPALTKLIELAGGAAEKFRALSGWIQSLGGNPRFFDAEGNEYDQNNNLIASPTMDVGTPLSPGDSNLLPPSPPTRTGSGVPLVNRGGGGRGGGGRSGRSDADAFDRLKDQFATQAELTQQEYEKQLTQLAEFRERKLATEEEFNDLEARIQKQHFEDMREIEAAAMSARLSSIGGALGDLASLMQSENRKLFKIGQAAAIAEATVSGYEAAVHAWEKGMKIGGPPVAAAFTAASLAKTGTLISSIASAGSGGGGGGGAGGSAAAAAPPAPLEVRLTGLGANDLIRGADVGSLLERLSEEAGDRGYRLMVAR